MKCPLLALGWSAAKGGDKVYPAECLQAECTWWDKPGIGCALVSISKNLGFINNSLHSIRDSMPSWQQFGKQGG